MYGKNLTGLSPAQANHVHNARLERDQARLDGTTRPTTPGTDMLGPGLDELFTRVAMDAATADWGARWASLCLDDVERVAAGHPDADIRERARLAAAKKRMYARKEEERARTRAAAEARDAARPKRTKRGGGAR